jgi:pectin methylesterase-like acyl-CoA thioesterase
MLTAKRKAFAQAVADGQSQADAYRSAFDAGRMSPGAVWTEASLLARNPQVALRVEELKAEAEEVRQTMLVGREEAILAQLEKEALTARTDSARIRAIELLGRHLGLFVDRSEVKDVTDRSADEIEADIRARLAQHSKGSA